MLAFFCEFFYRHSLIIKYILLTYKNRESQIVQSGIGQFRFPFKLSWTHYQVLMTIEDPAERNFYELEAIKGVWSVKTLKRQYGLHVTNLNIAQVKKKYGIIERENYNKPKLENSRQPGTTPEKENAITEALKFFKMI